MCKDAVLLKWWRITAGSYLEEVKSDIHFCTTSSNLTFDPSRNDDLFPPFLFKLYRNECDVAVVAFYQTLDRSKVVDFSVELERTE